MATRRCPAWWSLSARRRTGRKRDDLRGHQRARVTLYARREYPRAVPLVRSLPQPLVYSALHRLEIRNAFSLAVFRGHQTQAQAGAAWQNLEADLHGRVLVPISIGWHAALRHAAAIATSETPTLGSRSPACTDRGWRPGMAQTVIPRRDLAPNVACQQFIRGRHSRPPSHLVPEVSANRKCCPHSMGPVGNWAQKQTI